MFIMFLSYLIPIIEILVLIIADNVRFIQNQIEFVGGVNSVLAIFFYMSYKDYYPGIDMDNLTFTFIQNIPKFFIVAFIVGVIFRLIGRTMFLKKLMSFISSFIISLFTYCAITYLTQFKESMNHPIIYFVGSVVLFIVLMALNFKIINIYVPIRRSRMDSKILKWLDKELPE